VHGLVTGTGLVNLMHSSGEVGSFLPPDVRVCTPAQDRLIKDDHFQAMFRPVVAEGIIEPGPYSLAAGTRAVPAENYQPEVMHRAGLPSFTTLKSNCPMSVGKEASYSPSIRLRRQQGLE